MIQKCRNPDFPKRADVFENWSSIQVDNPLRLKITLHILYIIYIYIYTRIHFGSSIFAASHHFSSKAGRRKNYTLDKIGDRAAADRPQCLLSRWQGSVKSGLRSGNTTPVVRPITSTAELRLRSSNMLRHFGLVRRILLAGSSIIGKKGVPRQLFGCFPISCIHQQQKLTLYVFLSMATWITWRLTTLGSKWKMMPHTFGTSSLEFRCTRFRQASSRHRRHIGHRIRASGISRNPALAQLLGNCLGEAHQLPTRRCQLLSNRLMPNGSTLGLQFALLAWGSSPASTINLVLSSMPRLNVSWCVYQRSSLA